MPLNVRICLARFVFDFETAQMGSFLLFGSSICRGGRHAFSLMICKGRLCCYRFSHLSQVCFSSRSFLCILVTCIFRPVRLLHIRPHIEHVVDVFIFAVWFLSFFICFFNHPHTDSSHSLFDELLLILPV